MILAGGLTLAAFGSFLPLDATTKITTIAPPEAFASGSVRSRGPTVALLATRPGALHTSLYLAPAGGSETSAPVATFTHLAGAVVRGSVIPGTSIVLATADTKPTRDLSFNASLLRVAPHEPPEALCDGVVHASRPLITRSGRVFVSRGAPGPVNAAAPAEMRVDALSVDEVDPATGALRPIHTMSGYLAFLAGSIGSEILLYRVAPAGADIVAVDADTGSVRPILPSLPPFARDFSVDEGARALVFQGRHETDSRTWVVDRVDLASGKRSRLYEGSSMSLAPHVWPGGAVAYNPDGRSGLALLGVGALKVRGPLGDGVDVVLAASHDRRWLAALHTVQGALPAPFAINTETGAALALHGPPGARIAIAGFVPAEGGAQ